MKLINYNVMHEEEGIYGKIIMQINGADVYYLLNASGLS